MGGAGPAGVAQHRPAPAAGFRSIRPCMASPGPGGEAVFVRQGPLWRVGGPYSMVRMKLHQVDLPDLLGGVDQVQPRLQPETVTRSRP